MDNEREFTKGREREVRREGGDGKGGKKGKGGYRGKSEGVVEIKIRKKFGTGTYLTPRKGKEGREDTSVRGMEKEGRERRAGKVRG